MKINIKRGAAHFIKKNIIELTIGQRSIMVTQTIEGILGPLSHMYPNLVLD